MNQEEKFVRNAARNHILFFTEHAHDKMRKLKLDVSTVINCIETGLLVEQQDGYGGEDPRMVFYNGHNNSFNVVVAVTSQNCLTITVYEVDFDKWEKDGNSIKRR